ncbi:MAG: hypothetical protein WD205_00255, partial [Rhodothermales bacterium]
MRHLASLILACLILACLIAARPVAAQSHAQSYAQSPRVADVLPADGILRNSVTNLHARGDTLWAGPFLNVTFDGGENWFVADVDSLFGSRNTVFSIDVEGPVIW